MSLLDGYSGYNQVYVHEDDRDKTTFTTPWGAFHYAKMPFSLKNAGATFQRAMDLAFANEKDVFMVVYLDDLTVFFKSDEEHMYHLKTIFQKCRKYGLSLNPKKACSPWMKANYSGTLSQKMAFILTQHVCKQFSESICPGIRKRYNLSMALKDFRIYIVHSHILAYVPKAVVKDVLVQTDSEGRRGKWIVALLEYDVEIKPTNLVKGQGLAKLMAESNLHALDINLIIAMSDENEEGSSIQVSKMFSLSPWYLDIIYVLNNLSQPPGMTRNKSRTLKLKATKFCILDYALYWKNPGGIPLNCLLEKEAKKVMEDCHQGDYGGQLFWKSTTNKILRAGWILTATDYFTKWIEEILTRQATDVKLLEISKKSWHKRLVNALWEDRVSQNKSIGTSSFDLVYGFATIFPTSLAAPVVKLLLEAGNEEDPVQRRLNKMVHLQQTREEVFKNTSKLQEKIKKIYDKKAKVDNFQLDDVVLKWDARNEEKGKHSKFENLWKGPFKIAAYRGENTFLLKEMNGEDCPGGPINGRLLKWYHF
eukprot:PITA_06620